MLETLQGLLNDKKKILIATGTKHSHDVVFAGLALHLVFKTASIPNHFLSTRINKSQIWASKLSSFPEIEIKQSLPKNYTLSLPKEFDLKDIAWKRSDDEVLIELIAAEYKEALPKIKLKRSEGDFDLLIYIGNKSGVSPENIGFDPATKKELNTLFLFSRKVLFNNEAFESKELYLSKSFSYKALVLCEALKLPIPTTAATFFLAGLINHTDGFKKNINPQLFAAVTRLLEIGADYQKTYQLAIKDLTIKKMIFLGNLFSRTEEIAPGVFHAGLISKKPLNMRIEVSEMMKISELYNCKLAFVSIGTPQLNRIYIKNFDNKIDLKALLGKYNGKGNDKQGMIETKRALKEILSEIYTFLQLTANK